MSDVRVKTQRQPFNMRNKPVNLLTKKNGLKVLYQDEVVVNGRIYLVTFKEQLKS